MTSERIDEMAKLNAANERIKRKYFEYLKEAKRASEASVDAAAAAIARFEDYTKRRDFKRFHISKATAFKASLVGAISDRSGKPLAKATVNQTLAACRAFFVWLAGQPGFRSRLSYADADYFNLSEKDARVATTSLERPVPTLEQIRHTLSVMPTGTEIDRRNRAVVAFALLTGARDDAIASARIKHVDLAEGRFRQDAKDVRTKFSKSFDTW
jgi:integrase